MSCPGAMEPLSPREMASSHAGSMQGSVRHLWACIDESAKDGVELS